MPQISVILPVYNAERTLSQTLENLSDQRGGDFEIIAVDDGSVGRSLAILENHAQQDDRIKLIAAQHTGLVATLPAKMPTMYLTPTDCVNNTPFKATGSKRHCHHRFC